MGLFGATLAKADKERKGNAKIVADSNSFFIFFSRKLNTIAECLQKKYAQAEKEVDELRAAIHVARAAIKGFTVGRLVYFHNSHYKTNIAVVVRYSSDGIVIAPVTKEGKPHRKNRHTVDFRRWDGHKFNENADYYEISLLENSDHPVSE